jgi:DNA-binding SARP family transcriptional activator
MLALNANRVTPVDQLVSALWDIEPPSTARGQIQTCVSGLRKQFGSNGHPGEIRTRSPGYVLEIAPNDLDIEEFTTLVASARLKAGEGSLAEASGILRQALSLWRGPALADVDSDLVQRAAAKFEDARLSAIEGRIQLDLALGHHQEVISELATLVDEYPLRERLAEFHMLALYRSGRQGDALEVGRRTRATLVEELGVEPGHDLQKLAAAILNRDPALDLVTEAVEPPIETEQRTAEPEAHPRQLPASIADFTGREGAIEEIKQILSCGQRKESASYAVPIVSISGKGGVGKSCLAIRAAHELSDYFPDGVLFGSLQNPGEGDPISELLARFLHALGVSGSAMPEGVLERAQLYRSKVAGKKLLVVLDDVANEDQALPLLPGDPTCAVITTSRMRLSGLFGAHWVDVDEFETDIAMTLLVKIIGQARVQAEQESSAQLVKLCGGLPLALRIVGARLASRPHWHISALVRRLLDKASGLDEFTYRGLGLRFNIDLSYQRLRDEAQRLFRLFTLIRAADFPEWSAAALLDTDLVDAAEVLESLVDVRLLDTIEYPGEPVRYRFHSLIRIYAQERLMETETESERNAALTRVLGAWLALAEDTHRKEYGGDYTILHGTAPRWRPPGAERADSLENPMDWWAAERDSLMAAVRQAASAGMDELCWDLALTLVTFFEARGYFDDWRETAQLGLAVTENAGNRTGTAAMLYSLGTMHLYQKRLAEAEELFQPAMKMFTADRNTHGRALVQRNLALIDELAGKSTAMLAKYQDALELMRSVDDRMGEAHILRSVANYWTKEGDLDTARTMLEEALAICRDVACLRGEAQVLLRIAYLHLKTDEIDLAGQELNRVLFVVRGIGDRIGHVYGLYGLGVVKWREGQLDEAETAFEWALSSARLVRERLVEGQALCALGGINLARGETTVGLAQINEASQLFEEIGSTLLHAKTLILLSRIDTETDDVDHTRLLERARELLTGLDSAEATRWLTYLEASASPPPTSEIESLSITFD